MIKLYDYFRSSASFRVRLALKLKNIDHELIEVHLINDGGQQHHQNYTDLNPQGLVPCLIDNQTVISQSMSMLEYLEEKYPTPPLLPKSIEARAYVRQLSQLIACDVHPLNNLRVLQYLKDEYQISDQQKRNWYHHWLHQGFAAFENLLTKNKYTDTFCYQDHISFADLCLIPQVYNAYRFECPMEAYPNIVRIYEFCMQQKIFIDAAP